MAVLLVETKLFAPRSHRPLVQRARLDRQLRGAADARLTLISAPAGFGKTTLLAEWVTGSDAPIAWVSLEPSDNDAIIFWAYVAEALRRADPAAGTAAGTAAAMFRDPEPPPIASVLAAIVNDLASVDVDVALVLDDYHVIEAPEIHEQVAWLIEHMPPRVHVAIATRADPSFPMARLRARGELVEIRASDLRFTTEEAATYLNELMALGLEPSDIALLEERTEGWIAALQLAALSIQGRDDASAFIADFAGDDRFVVDLLVEEVLQRLPEELRTFLLQTSILERLTGPLCDAVTGRTDGAATLDALDRDNLFVVPLDARRAWYRYHHLFSDMLRARLADERAEAILELHLRASTWYASNGERDEAIRHALAGEDHDRAAHLIEVAIPDLRQARQDATMRRLLGVLPAPIFHDRPVLAVGYVGALMSNGEMQDVDALLAGAERWLHPGAPSSGMIVADRRELARLPSAIAMYRAAQAQLRGDLDSTLSHAHRALELAGDEDPLGRGGAAGFLALAHWASGDLEAAHGSWTDAMASLERAGHAVDAIAIVRAVAEIRGAQGRLRDARRAYERGLERAQAGRSIPLRGAADMHTGLAELALETHDLDAAVEHLLASTQLDERGLGLPQNAYRRRVVSALVRAAEGDADAGLALLQEAEAAFVGEYFPVVRPIPALRARMHLAVGRLADAGDWVAERALAHDDDLDYLHEFEHVTLARYLIARSKAAGEAALLQHGVALLDRLLAEAEAGGRQRTAIEVLVLLALARRELGEDPSALGALGRAMKLAEPEGYVRPFVAEGAPMTALLEAAVAHGIGERYARRLLTAGDRPPKQPLPEPLSERELEVLRLLATELSGPDIASELVVGLSTVRSHTKSIYAKLDVNSRRAAVRRGEELGLTTGPSGRRR